ncbi:methyltransferase domain-containing protein [Nonlabens sp.]|uniref:methyltransferase domain-containing protein n=1 Tax=Nonlabens sp. TaxID=1888209 RepID=UPI003F69E2DF
MFSDQECPLCDKMEFELLHNRDRFQNELNNCICKNCGFVMVIPRPTNESHENLYLNGDFSSTARGSEKPSPSKISRAESIAFKNYSKLVESLPSKDFDNIQTVLEIGCGAGSFLRLCQAAGKTVKGIEPDYVYSDYGRKTYALEIDSLFFENYECQDKYDLIANFHVIEHVSNPRVFLQKIFNSLNVNGIVYIECPTLDSLYGPSLDHFFWAPHINSFSNNTLKFLLEDLGFEIINLELHRGFINIIAKKSRRLNSANLPSKECLRISNLVKEKKSNNDNRSSIGYKVKYELYKFVVNTKRKLLKLKTGFKSSSTSLLTDKIRIAHIGLHGSGNTGDIALFQAVRREYEVNLGKIQWSLINIHSNVDDKLIEILNDHDAIVVGGGGLFLSDTNTNEISNWQWAIPLNLYEKINVPLFLHAVGYNQFRDQDGFASFFNQNVQKLVNVSSFFGMRNNGSIKKFSKHINNKNEGIVFHPCPTTNLQSLFPEFTANAMNKTKKTIAVNIAFDRHHLRYGEFKTADKILNRICDALKTLKNEGCEIINLIHGERDGEFNIWAKKNDLEISELNLIGASIQEIFEKYSTLDLVIGTRGHAQMIPYGLNISIISLISHDKLKYFLEDIGEQERGIEVHDDELTDILISKSRLYLSNASYEDSKARLEKVVSRNFEQISSNLNKS